MKLLPESKIIYLIQKLSSARLSKKWFDVSTVKASYFSGVRHLQKASPRQEELFIVSVDGISKHVFPASSEAGNEFYGSAPVPLLASGNAKHRIYTGF